MSVVKSCRIFQTDGKYHSPKILLAVMRISPAFDIPFSDIYFRFFLFKTVRKNINAVKI